MPSPGLSPRTVADLVPEVVNALQQRTDVASLAPLYIKRATQEITESYPFEELRVTGPLVVLTPNNSIYPMSTFVNPGDDYTSPEVVAIYVDFPKNTVVSTMKYRTPTAIEMMIAPATKGLPSRWTRFGDNIHVGPTPDRAYTMFIRYQIRHPFPQPSADATSQLSAPLYIPDTWEEIIVYAAAERIAIVKRWADQAKEMHDILYGDPEYVSSEGLRGRPGLIAARRFQVERDEKFNERQLTPMIPRYNPR